MDNSYTTVKNMSEYRYEEKKSVFIGHCAPVGTEAEALDFIAGVKKSYPDAKHHVYAYVLRDNSISRFTDDREPSGTAGMPVLDAIRKNGCVNTVIVVVRYFGGVLLGTGGLVRAYTEAALGALNAARIITYNTYTVASLSVSYSDYQRINSLFEKYSFLPNNIEYTENVMVFGSVVSSDFDDFSEKITEYTAGRAKITKIKEEYDFRA